MASRRNLKLASFDGGGTRTFSQLEIMRAVMHRVRWDKYPGNHDRVMLPCEHFDLIGGSDTGGLVAILFVKLKMSVEEVIVEFGIIVEEVYAKDLEPTERTKRLRKCMETLLLKKGLPANAPLENEPQHGGCICFVLAALSVNMGNKVYLRSYPVRRQPSSTISIVDAVLATCTSKPDFAPAAFGSGYNRKEYVGAGLGANNPVRHVIAEAQSHFGGEPSISLLLSLGSGNPGIISLIQNGNSDDVNRVALEMMSDCEQKAQEVRQQIGPTGIYFRFSVEQGMQRDIHTLAEELGWISAQTESYLGTQETIEKVDKCVERMRSRSGDVTLNQLNRLSGLPPTYIEARAVMIPQDFSQIGVPQMNDVGKRTLRPSKSYRDILCDTSIPTLKCQGQSPLLNTETSEDTKLQPTNEDLGAVDLIQGLLSAHGKGKPDHTCDAPRPTTSRSWSTFMTSQPSIIPTPTSFMTPAKGPHLDDNSHPPQTPENAIDSVGGVDMVTLTIMDDLASTYAKLGNTSMAEPLQTKVLEGRKARLGMKHLDTLAAMASLASTFYRQKRYVEAESLYVMALEEWGSQCEMGRSDARTAVGNLELIYLEQGRHAEVQYLRSKGRENVKDHIPLIDTEWSESSHPKGNPYSEPHGRGIGAVCEEVPTDNSDSATISAFSSSNTTYGDESSVSITDTLQVDDSVDEKVHSKADPVETFASMASLASTHHQEKRYAEAEFLYTKALASWSALIGLEHPDTIAVMHNLGLVYHEQGLHPKAEVLQISVLEARKKSLGLFHLDTLAAMACLASTYYTQRRYSEAEPLYVKLLKGWNSLLGIEHLDALDAMGSLACIYQRQRRYLHAERLHKRVLIGCSSQLGESHSETLTVMQNLASMYHEQGRHSEAEILQLKVLEGRKTSLGDTDPMTLTAMHMLALTYHKQGRHLEAEQLRITVLYNRKRQLGGTDLATLSAMYNLASTYHKQGRHMEAETLRFKVFESRKAQLGEDHPDTLITMAKLASTYHSQGRHSDAANLQAKDLESCMKLHGRESQQVAVCAHNLGLSYYHLGRLNKAKRLAIMAAKIYKRLLGAHDSHFKETTKLLELLDEPTHDKQWYYQLL